MYVIDILCSRNVIFILLDLYYWTKKNNIERLEKILKGLLYIGVFLSFLFILIFIKKISFKYNVEILCIIALIEILILESFKLFGNE